MPRVRGRERRREKEKGKEGAKKREKRKREKGKRKMEREKERELSAGFTAAVDHARAAAFGRSATSMRNERKGKGIGRRLVLVSGRRIAGTGFREIGSSGGKEFWIDLSSALKRVLKIIFLGGDLFGRIFGMLQPRARGRPGARGGPGSVVAGGARWPGERWPGLRGGRRRCGGRRGGPWPAVVKGGAHNSEALNR